MHQVESGWLIGSRGIHGRSAEGWTRLGAGAFGVTAILRRPDGLLVGSEAGLWQIPAGTDQWVQWHDETLTLVSDLGQAATGAGEPTLVAATGYGVATCRLDEAGAPRWDWPAADLGPDRRYTNALLIDDDAPARWLAGTEAGLYCTENGGAKWTGTSLVGEPVRALLRAGGSYWAGADSGGVWRSADGLSWAPAGEGLGDTPVYALAWTGDRLLAGTERGVAQGDGRGPWQLSELPLRVAAVATGRDRWLAGACPGGLWCSRDMGATWTRDGDFQHVRAIEPPEEE